MTNPFQAMKGPARRLISLISDRTNVHLVDYADGSWGIVQGDMTLGVWEPSEHEHCIAVFARFMKHSPGEPLLLMSSRTAEAILPFNEVNLSNN